MASSGPRFPGDSHRVPIHWLSSGRQRFKGLVYKGLVARFQVRMAVGHVRGAEIRLVSVERGTKWRHRGVFLAKRAVFIVFPLRNAPESPLKTSQKPEMMSV